MTFAYRPRNVVYVRKVGRDEEKTMVELTTAEVARFPACDVCQTENRVARTAAYDGKTVHGPWAFMCEAHFKTHGVGLGTGRGQVLVEE